MQPIVRDQLVANLKALQCDFPGDASLQSLVTAIRRTHGDSVMAVLYYGSCLRRQIVNEGVADFYVIVDGYRRTGMGWLRAGLNRLLPPNVFYLEREHSGSVVRAKYAVISLRQFRAGAGGRWLLPYLWGRFAQPAGLIWSRDESVAEQLWDVLARALIHFVAATVPVLPRRFSCRDLWEQGLLLSYATELRAEKRRRIRALYDDWRVYYRQQTAIVLARVMPQVAPLGDHYYRHSYAAHTRRRAARRWRLRRLIGKPVALLRLLKSLLTFRGAVDYAAWKIERHSGEPVVMSARARRWPLLGGWVILWRLLRRGILR